MKKIFLVFLLSFVVVVFSQDDEENNSVSKNDFFLDSKSTILRDISESKTEFLFNKSDSNSVDSINGSIDLFSDSEIKKRWAEFYFDGNKTTKGKKINIGGEWNIPIFLYNHSGENRFEDESIAANTINYKAAAVSLGFVAQNTNKDFPFKFSAGPSFEGGLWNQNRDTVFGAGGYFSVIGGDTLGSRIAESPFFFGSEIFGRYIKSEQNNRNLAAKSVLVFDKNGIFATDTFSISVNNAIGLGEVNSQFAYMNSIGVREIPNKYANNLSIVFRATKIGNAFFEPSFEITAIDSRYRYLNTDIFYGSLKKNTISALAFLNKELGDWNFETGIRFSGTKEENSYFSGKNGTGTISDTLNEKLKDADIFNPQFYFLTEFTSPKEIIALSARFVVERNRRLFPFHYEQNGLTISNGSDVDLVTQQIKLQGDFYLTKWYNLYISAERIKNQIYFLKSKMSASSRTDERYAVELGNVFSKDSIIIFSLRGLAVAAPQKYRFANFGGVPHPSHNRSFGLISDLALSYTNGWGNNFGFSVTKFDRGIIYNGNYYGIESRNRETVSSISLIKNTKKFILAGGFEAKIQKYHNFIEEQNDYENTGNIYILSPFVSGNFTFNDHLTIDFYTKRNIIKGKMQGNTPPKDFWDISLNLSAYF